MKTESRRTGHQIYRDILGVCSLVVLIGMLFHYGWTPLQKALVWGVIMSIPFNVVYAWDRATRRQFRDFDTYWAGQMPRLLIVVGIPLSVGMFLFKAAEAAHVKEACYFAAMFLGMALSVRLMDAVWKKN